MSVIRPETNPAAIGAMLPAYCATKLDSVGVESSGAGTGAGKGSSIGVSSASPGVRGWGAG